MDPPWRKGACYPAAVRLRAFLPVALLVLGVDGPSTATDGGSDPVLVQVGTSTVRESELRYLLGRMHEFERSSYGKTGAEVARGFIQTRLVPELLYAEEAKRVGESAGARATVRAALGQALKAELEQEFEAKLTRAQLVAHCQRTSDPKTCDGDLFGHRVVMRREHSAKELERIASELRTREVKAVDLAALEQLPATSGAPPTAPSSRERQP